MVLAGLQALVQKDLDAVHACMDSTIDSDIPLIHHITHHLIDSGGKRLRPLLLLLSAHACGYQGTKHIKLAAMVEFFHTASLLHDDVVDESDLRRGKQTAHTLWGNKGSILVGDYLYTQSVRLMIANINEDILKLMADTQLEMSAGEIQQLTYRYDPQLSIDNYLQVIRGKTALLFAACAEIGAILGAQSEIVRKQLYRYGLHIGYAFQLIDDILDYSADSKTLGKNVGDDFTDGKMTMPLLYALESASPDEKTFILENLHNPTAFPAVLAIIKQTGALEYTAKRAAQAVETALICLEVIKPSTFKDALGTFARFTLERFI